MNHHNPIIHNDEIRCFDLKFFLSIIAISSHNPHQTHIKILSHSPSEMCFREKKIFISEFPKYENNNQNTVFFFLSFISFVINIPRYMCTICNHDRNNLFFFSHFLHQKLKIDRKTLFTLIVQHTR